MSIYDCSGWVQWFCFCLPLSQGREKVFVVSFLPILPPPPFTFSSHVICAEYEGLASCVEYLSNQKVNYQRPPSLISIRNKSSYPPHSELVSTIEEVFELVHFRLLDIFFTIVFTIYKVSLEKYNRLSVRTYTALLRYIYYISTSRYILYIA